MIRLFFSSLISLSLALNGSLAFADSKSDADKMFKQADQAARLVADDLFRSYLMAGFIENSGQAQVLTNMMTGLSQVADDIRSYQGQSAETLLTINDAEQMLANETNNYSKFKKHIESALESYNQAMSAADISHYTITAAQVTSSSTSKNIEQIVSHLKSTCQQGVAGQFDFPSLPPISIRPPGFSVGFRYSAMTNAGTITSDATLSPYASPDVGSFMDGDDAGMYVAMGGTGISLGVYYALVYGLGYEAGAMLTLAMTGVYSAVVGFAIYMVLDWQARKQAEREAQAVQNSVLNRADANTVAMYFRELCKAHATPLLNLPSQIETLITLPADSPERVSFNADQSRTDEISKRISILVHALEAKKAALADQSKITGEELQKQLRTTDEYKAADTYIRGDLGMDGLVDLMRVQLTALALGANATAGFAAKINEMDQNDVANGKKSVRLQLKSQRARLVHLMQVAYEQSLEATTPGAVAAFQIEMKANADIAAAYSQWQKLYSQYLVDIFNNRSTEVTTQELKAFQIHVAELRSRSNSDLLDLISRRLQVFLGDAL